MAAFFFSDASFGCAHDVAEGAGERRSLERTPSLASAADPFKSRWRMLTLFALVAASNAFMFMSLASVANLAAEYYDTSTAGIHSVAQAVYLGYMIVVPVAMAVSRRCGMKNAIVTAAVINAAGATMRAMDNLHMMIVGSFFVGVSLAFFIGVPTWLSTTWFKEEERPTATAVCTLATQLGLALGYVVPPQIITPDVLTTSFSIFNCGTCIACLMIAVAVAHYFEDDPILETQSSAGGSQWSLSSIFANRDFLLVLIQFGLTTAIYWTIALVLATVLHDTYSHRQIQVMGSLYLFAGLISMAVTGVYFGKMATNPPYRIFIASMLVMSTGLLAAFSVAVQQSGMFITTTIIVVLLGTVLPTVQSVYLELAVEYTPDVPEEISGSILYLAAFVTGFFLPFMVEPRAGQEHMFWIADVRLTIAVGICAIMVFALSSDYKRVQQRCQFPEPVKKGYGSASSSFGASLKL